MTQDREEMLKKAVEKAKEAVVLIQELEDWKKKAKKVAITKLYFFKKNNNLNTIVRALKEIVQYPRYLKETFGWQNETLIKQEEDEQKKLTLRAIVWLIERGCILEKDFDLDTAIERANWLSFEQEKQTKLCTFSNIQKPDFFIFEGKENCEEDCRGWDGISHRCDCGNRRVNWEMTDYHSFETPSIVGRAS